MKFSTWETQDETNLGRERAQTIADLVNKAFKKQVLTVGLPDELSQPKEFIPSGSLSLDYALGGGWLCGGMSEVFGAEGAGKSTLADAAIAESQRMGKVAVRINTEFRYDRGWAQKQGIDLDSLLVFDPPQDKNGNDIPMPAEEVLDKVKKTLELVPKGDLGLMVIDSWASLVPEAEIEADSMDKDSYGGLGKIGSRFQRLIQGTGILSNSGSHLMILNQIRDKIGSTGYGPKTDTPGGHAIRHMASQRVEVRRGEYSDTEEFDPIINQKIKRRLGNAIEIQVVKNSCSPPHRRARIYLDYSIGLDRVDELFNIASGYRVIGQSGAWYQYTNADGELKGRWQGRTNAVEGLRSDPDLSNIIRAEVKSMIAQGVKV